MNLFRQTTTIAAAIAFVIGNVAYAGSLGDAPDMKIKPAVTVKLRQFPLEDVRLLESPFKHAMELDGKYLLSIEPDRLLAGFRETAGLTPKAKQYGGWETGSLAGHTLGHYLTACSQMYASTGDKRYLERVNYIVDELETCQNANGNGYIAAIPNGQKTFAVIATGDIKSQYFDLNGLWSPWYDMHKTFAGLLDAYHYCGNQKALVVDKKFADWAISITSKLTDEQWQKMLYTEYGGMNDSLAQLYAVTGEKKYLDIAQRFYDKDILDPLAAGKDNLPGRHSNTQIPKIIGMAWLYELTGNQADKNIADYFWNTVVYHHSYVTGGNSMDEYFGPEDKLADRLSSKTTETCNTYNMLKLTEHLFEWDPQAKYIDFYERAVYNHTLASKDPIAGGVTYFVPLKSGGAKSYSTPFDDFTCCVGTGMESHSKYGKNIYYHNDSELYVNLFIPSVLNWKDKGLTVRQDTDFPAKDTIRLTFTCDRPVNMPVHIRYPYWAKNGLKAKINGKSVKVEGTPSSYVTVNREWKTGDKLDVQIPMSLRLEPMPDKANRVSILYGPIVLAGNLGAENTQVTIPVLLTNGARVESWLKPVKQKPLTFMTNGVAKPKDVTLTPFYATHHVKYQVYWDLFTDAEWKAREGEIRAEEQRVRELEAKTVDFFQPGEMQPERDHNLKAGERVDVGDEEGRKFRWTMGSWFTFDMKVPSGAPSELVLTYFGKERREAFDILVDGQKVGSYNGNDGKTDQFYDVSYPLPDTLTAGKTTITVRIEAPNGRGGRLFGARVVKK